MCKIEIEITAQEHAKMLSNAARSADQLRDLERDDDVAIARQAPGLLDPNPATGPESCPHILDAYITQLETIILQKQPLSHDQCSKVPNLVRDIRRYLVAFYDVALKFRDATATDDYQPCTAKQLTEYAVSLHTAGDFLFFHPTRLLNLLHHSHGDLAHLLIEEEIGISYRYNQTIALDDKIRNSKPSRAQLREITEQTNSIRRHHAARKLIFFLGPLWCCAVSAFTYLGDFLGVDNLIRCSWKRLVYFTTKTVGRHAVFTAISYNLDRLIRKDHATALHFMEIGGFPAVVSLLCANIVQHKGKTDYGSYVEMFPEASWERLSSGQVACIFEMMVHLLDQSPEQYTQPLRISKDIAYLLFKVFTVFGIVPFNVAARQSFNCMFFPFICNRLSRKPRKYDSADSMLHLMQKFDGLTSAALYRYIWLSFSVDDRRKYATECCDYTCCDEKAYFGTLIATKKDWAESDDHRLERRGEDGKLCGGCRLVLYCSRECQRAAWPNHRDLCRRVQSGGERSKTALLK